jgi:hypothetical protein
MINTKKQNSPKTPKKPRKAKKSASSRLRTPMAKQYEVKEYSIYQGIAYVMLSGILLGIVWGAIRWYWLKDDWLPMASSDLPKFIIPILFSFIHLYISRNWIRSIHNKVETKFHKGDWVVLSTSDGEKVVQIDSVEYFKSGEPRYITSEGRWFGNGTKAHLWTIQDAKDGDILVNGNSILIFKRFEENRVYRHCSLYIDNSTNHFSHTYNTFTPATKEQRELLFQKMKETGYEWDSEKKELRIVQKPKWTDEDEELLQHCCGAVAAADYYTLEDKEEMENWLKSLKQRMEQ